MYMPSSRPRLWGFLVGILALALSGWVAAEPPSRAARLSYISGTVSFSPAGQPDWLRAVVNRPLTTGDRLWVEASRADAARAEASRTDAEKSEEKKKEAEEEARRR